MAKRKKQRQSYRQARLTYINTQIASPKIRAARRIALLRMSSPDYRKYIPRPIDNKLISIKPMRRIPRTVIKTIRRAQSPLSVLRRVNPKTYLPHKLAVKVPRRALLCIKRGLRKEILHATNKTGKSGQQKPRFTQHSQYRC